jgi:hypothetical protein
LQVECRIAASKLEIKLNAPVALPVWDQSHIEVAAIDAEYGTNITTLMIDAERPLHRAARARGDGRVRHVVQPDEAEKLRHEHAGRFRKVAEAAATALAGINAKERVLAS